MRGGVRSYKDVLDYLKAGAELIEIGSANFYEDENIYQKILLDLELFLRKNNWNLNNFLKLRSKN